MECNTSCEPMDIDLSSNSANAMDISYNDPAPHEEGINTELVTDENQRPSTTFKKLVVHLNENKSNSRKRTLYIYISGIIILLISCVLYQINANFKCHGNLNIQRISDKMSTRLYGQSTASSKIINTLRSHTKNKILIMYGRTGVGKTLSVSLILEDIMNFSNIYHYTMPTFVDMFSTDLLLGLTLCQNSIVVIDDLKSNDTSKIKDKLSSLLIKTENLNKNITIILVYNCDATSGELLNDCVTLIKSEMKSFNDNDENVTEYIEFDSLDETTLRKCVEYELGRREISEEKFKYILKNFNVIQDGCKNVHQKMKYLNIL
ncbi:uncharacterized protein LOC119831120 [Zerene cesonia]|uniref:uncharacterized protein LOC119831120 n=1 Tax=Zerene cesonia TaxID=33412 RepID=UPI0018E55C35|nr:uncharacterized protein LOC119831120 [Zerene cesonia]